MCCLHGGNQILTNLNARNPRRSGSAAGAALCPTISRRMHKNIETIPSETMTSLVNYGWPGNIRELQGVIERAVIVSDGSVLRVPIGDLKSLAWREGY